MAGDRRAGTELSRLRGLYGLDLIDRGVDSRFDPIVRLAARSLGVPIALVTLIDADRQWFCASTGTDLDGTTRSESFCAQVIDDDIDILVVEDTAADERFSELQIVVGVPHVRFYAGATIRTSDGSPLGTVCVLDVEPRSFDDEERAVLRDLADLVQRELRQVELATTDEMTGLANRRSFEATLDRYLLRDVGPTRTDGANGDDDAATAVVFGDVDGLKAVNDSAGHGVGDDLLQRAATILSEATGPGDVAARLGGDEFAVLLRHANDADVTALIGQLQSAIAESNRTVAPDRHVAISFGYAVARSGDTSASLIDRADGAMYDVKEDRIASRVTPD